MDASFGSTHLLFTLASALLWLALIVGIVVAVVQGLRALRSIDRSLKEIAAQG